MLLFPYDMHKNNDRIRMAFFQLSVHIPQLPTDWLYWYPHKVSAAVVHILLNQ